MPHPELIPFESLIHKLTMLASSDFGRVHGLNYKLERLCHGVERMKAMLVDDQGKIDKDVTEAIQIWIREIKDHVYAADDFFDKIATEILHLDGGKVRSLFSCINAFVFRLQIAREVDEKAKSFECMWERGIKFGFGVKWEHMMERNSDWARGEKGWEFNESVVFGREGEKREIIRMLVQSADGNQNVSVIGVVGMGGMGKTTLAQIVYNDPQVQDFFDIRMWVCVSEDFVVKTIGPKILVSSSGSKSNHRESMETLQIQLHKQLNGKRYLLVLDDVWNEDYEKWTELKTYLMCGAQRSKILATTRSEKVAEVMEALSSNFGSFEKLE